MNHPILLAFSGGIDSCAAVEILQKQGYSVVAMTIDMMGDSHLISQAQESAKNLNIELHIIDSKALFESEIIDNFTAEYTCGRTPAPCTRCNTLIKWRILREKADQLGIEKIATGHYFKISKHNEKLYVTRGDDPKKDQSYYLWGLSQEILKRAVTPLGDQFKAEIKATSRVKKESMGVCFLKNSHYTEFITQRCGEMAHGDIIDQENRVVGRHNGVARYTIGQRRGEGIPAGDRVIALDATNCVIRVGDNALLYHKELTIDQCYFVDHNEVTSADNISVMVRGLGLNPEGFAKVTILESDPTNITAKVELQHPAWAAAPGQPIVLYIGDRVVGGGYLKASN